MVWIRRACGVLFLLAIVSPAAALSTASWIDFHGAASEPAAVSEPPGEM